MASVLSRVAALLLLAGCTPTPLGDPPVVMELCLDNPERLTVTVDVVDGDTSREVASPGPAARLCLQLLAGTYVVRATSDRGATAPPAPLLAVVLPGRRLHLTIHSPPASETDFAFVPGGPALIGDTLGIGQEDERPARVVDVAPFWIARCEVTNAEYAAFLTAVEPHVDERWCAFDSKKCLVSRDPAGRWTTTSPTLPIVTVSLAGALAWCRWRTQVTSVHHRLPTESEWEKAARGPASAVFAYGNVYRRALANQESGALHAVDVQAQEGFGVADMTGNAFEWTSCAWRAGPGAPPDAAFQVLRGGSFVLDGMYLRNSFRMKQRPEVRTDDIGFRVVRDCTDRPE